jgi:hypothetical protein
MERMAYTLLRGGWGRPANRVMIRFGLQRQSLVDRIQSRRPGMVSGGPTTQRTSWGRPRHLHALLERGRRSASKNATGERRLRNACRRARLLRNVVFFKGVAWKTKYWKACGQIFELPSCRSWKPHARLDGPSARFTGRAKVRALWGSMPNHRLASLFTDSAARVTFPSG